MRIRVAVAHARIRTVLPVAKTCELFAERWTPLIIRELCCGPALFNDLRRRLPLMFKTLLTQRLHELEHAGVVSIVEMLSRCVARQMGWPGYQAGCRIRLIVVLSGPS